MSKSDLEARFLRQITREGIPEPTREHVFAPPRRWRFDMCWMKDEAPWLAVEIDGGIWNGGRHVRPAGYEADCQKLNAATMRGWNVLRFTAKAIDNGEAIRTLKHYFGVKIC
jgi:hypothetical protein